MTTARGPAAPLQGQVRVPGDKSIGHRACIFSALAEGRSTVTGLSHGADISTTLAVLQQLGVAAQITHADDGTRTAVIEGRGLGGLSQPVGDVDCGNSGTTIRLMMGVLAGQRQIQGARLIGDASLSKRPMARVSDPLSALGAHIELPEGDHPPVVMSGVVLNSPEGAIDTGGASAQVKSALLLAGVQAQGPVTVVERGPSRDHTERMLLGRGVPVQIEGRQITVTPVSQWPAMDQRVPGDPSSAAFWLGAAALIPGSDITVEGISLNPTRTGILDILQSMGADLQIDAQGEAGGEPIGAVRLRYRPLTGVDISGDVVVRAIDELPLVAALAALAEGETRITGARELRVKESDRVAAMAEMLTTLGGRVDALEDGWHIEGVSTLGGGAVKAYHDHRIAMVAGILDRVTTAPVVIDTPEVAAVSYPTFLTQLNRMTAR
ncbi:MAG: 3-phosphoshikimate 1-carboxyvinyltransferase [Bradymonadia bacterium]